VLEQARMNPFLQHGYGQLKDPNLAWLFMPSPKGRGIDRVSSVRLNFPEAP
jgi:hypothetical protein